MEETGDGLERYVLAYFGLPSLLHSDNGQVINNYYYYYIAITIK